MLAAPSASPPAWPTTPRQRRRHVLLGLPRECLTGGGPVAASGWGTWSHARHVLAHAQTRHTCTHARTHAHTHARTQHALTHVRAWLGTAGDRDSCHTQLSAACILCAERLAEGRIRACERGACVHQVYTSERNSGGCGALLLGTASAFPQNGWLGQNGCA